VIPGRLVFPALRWHEDTGFAHEERTIAEALEFGAGGFILFGGTRDAVRALTTRLRREAGRRLLLAADLERGPAQQVQGLAELPPPLALSSLHDGAVIRGAGLLTGAQALAVGINWVLAPVCDLDLEPDNPIVQTRAFGSDPIQVGEQVASWIAGCEAAGALACAKHFPGHGRTVHDSHDTLPVVDVPADQLRATDLVPFQAAVEVGVATVMTAHVAYPALDPSGTPATFSPIILDELRRGLGFTGLIVSDALIMKGAHAGRSPAALAREAIEAGVDLLLYPDAPAEVARALTAAVRDDSEFAIRVGQAHERYVHAMARADETLPDDLFDDAGSARALGDWLLSAPLLRGEPPALEPPLELTVVDDDAGERYPPSSSPQLVHDALLARGVPLGVGGSRIVLLYVEPRASKGRAGLSESNAARLQRLAADAALVVVFGHPRVAARVPEGPAVLLAWHRQALMQEAVARWLAARMG
jgi:beta-glucosidase-like glycosyl hydrolase